MSDEQRALYVSDRANFYDAHAYALATGDGASAVKFVRRLGRVTGAVGANARDWYARAVASVDLRQGTREDRAWALVRTARAANFMRRVRSSSELARRSRRPFRRARGRARERRRNRGAMRRRAINRKLRPTQVELAERLAALTQSLDDADPAAAAARTRTPSEAQWTLALALLGRALEENDRAAAERSPALLRGRERTPPRHRGRWWNRRGRCNDLAFSLFVLEAYSEGIATGQRALRKLLELEATLATETGWVADFLFSHRDLLMRERRRRRRHQPRQRRPPHVPRGRRRRGGHAARRILPYREERAGGPRRRRLRGRGSQR